MIIHLNYPFPPDKKVLISDLFQFFAVKTKDSDVYGCHLNWPAVFEVETTYLTFSAAIKQDTIYPEEIMIRFHSLSFTHSHAHTHTQTHTDTHTLILPLLKWIMLTMSRSGKQTLKIINFFAKIRTKIVDFFSLLHALSWRLLFGDF